MKWPTVIVAIALAGSPIVARQSSTDDLKGRAVVLRACVIPGISNSLLLSRVQIPPTATAVSPHPVRYLFDKPGNLGDFLGGEVEIQAQVREVKPGDTELNINDGVLAEIQAADEAVGTAGTEELPPVLKMDISKIKMLSTVCR